MKLIAVALAALIVVAAVRPATAFVVEVTTSIAVSDADDQAMLKSALQTAVDGVLKDAIAFKPTLVVLTRALVMGDRLYIRLLVADQDGEQTVKELAEPNDDSEPSATPRTRRPYGSVASRNDEQCWPPPSSGRSRSSVYASTIGSS